MDAIGPLHRVPARQSLGKLVQETLLMAAVIGTPAVRKGTHSQGVRLTFSPGKTPSRRYGSYRQQQPCSQLPEPIRRHGRSAVGRRDPAIVVAAIPAIAVMVVMVVMVMVVIMIMAIAMARAVVVMVATILTAFMAMTLIA